jgi:hypothetical protein
VNYEIKFIDIKVEYLILNHLLLSSSLDCESGSSSDPISGSDSGLSSGVLVSEGGFSPVTLSNITGGVTGSSVNVDSCIESIVSLAEIVYFSKYMSRSSGITIECNGFWS